MSTSAREDAWHHPAALGTLFLAVSAAGCTQNPMGTLHADGSTAPIVAPAPSTTYVDPTAPGTGIVGIATINGDFNVNPLIVALQSFFAYSDPDAHAMMVLNPSAQHLAEGQVTACTPGSGHACLMLGNPWGSLGEPATDFRVTPYFAEASAWPLVFQGLVQTNSASEPDQWSGLVPGLLGGIATDQTGLEELRMLTPQVGVPPLSPGWWVEPPLPDQHMKIMVGKTYLKAVNDQVGLWTPVYLQFPPDFVRYSECNCNEIEAGLDYSSFPMERCAQVCDDTNSAIDEYGSHCGIIKMATKLSMIRIDLGIVPYERTFTDDLVDPPIERRTGWMKNLPNGSPFRQNKLGVRPVVVVDPMVFFPVAEVGDVPAYSGNAVWADLGDCSGPVGDICALGIADCAAEATTRAGWALNSQIPAAVGAALETVIEPLFSYVANAESPFLNGPPSGPPCSLDSDACIQLIREHYLPASLTFMTYSWFAGILGPADNDPAHQYPFWKLVRSCPPGAKLATVQQLGVAEGGKCFKCPDGLPWNESGQCPFECGGGATAGGCYDTTSPYETWTNLAVHYLADPDNDGLLAPDDSCPFDNSESQVDSDGDGLGDVCDPCPFTSDHTDYDGDGHADACEPALDCPCDPVSDPAHPQDHDHVCGYCDGTLGGPGGFCETYCGGADVFPIDNCPAVDNDDQKNCNERVERIRTAAKMGDACDPVPCPSFIPVNEGDVLYTGPLDQDTNGFALWVDTTQWVELSSIRMSPIGAHRSLGSEADPAQHASPPEEHLVEVDSDYRACVDLGPPNNIKCNDDGQVANKFLVNSANVGAEDQFSVWHRVWMKGVTKPGTASDGSDWNPLDPGVKYFSAWSPLDKVWRWKDDYQRWSQGWGSGIIPSSPSAPGEASALFWAHGRTNVGESEDPFTYGLHPIPPDDSGLDANDHSRLVSYYEVAQPIAEVTSRWFKKLPQTFWPPWYAHFCPDCPVEISLPSTECASCGALGRIQGQGGPYETQVLVALPSDMGSEVGVLRDDGRLQLVTSKLGARLRETLASDAIMLSAVEPTTSIGGGERQPAAVALSPDGTVVRDKILQRTGGFLSQHDLETDVGDTEPARVSSLSMTAGDAAGPAPRKEFQAVYSRAMARLFLVGGTDLSTNRLTHDIWWRDVNGFDWLRVPLQGYAPERVMAATWSYRDRQLWVLDQVQNGAVPNARLVRIDPVSGKDTVIGVWPRLRMGANKWVFDRHWLVLDHDGNVLLAASSSQLNKHVIVRVEVDGDTPVVDGVRIGPFAFAAPPAVDPDGYSLILERKNKLPELKRVRTLDARPGRWLDVGGCL